MHNHTSSQQAGRGVIKAVRKDIIACGETKLETDCEIAWTKRPRQ